MISKFQEVIDRATTCADAADAVGSEKVTLSLADLRDLLTAAQPLGVQGKLDLDRLHALHSTATSAPWKADATQPDDVVIWGPRVDGDDRMLMNVAGANPSQVGIAFDCDKINGELIVEMRNGLPALLAIARRTSSPDLVAWASRLAQILSTKENSGAFWHPRQFEIVAALRRVGPPPTGDVP